MTLQQITFVGTPIQAVNAAGTTLTFTRPVGLKTGDYLIAVCRSQNPGSANDWACAGFVRAVGPTFVPSSSGGRVQGFYVKKVAFLANEPASYTFDVQGVAQRCVGTLLTLRGYDSAILASPPNGATYSGDGITGGKRLVAYSIPIPALVLLAGGVESTSPNDHAPLTIPAGYDQVDLITTSTNLGVSRTALWVGQAVITTGTTQVADITWTNPSSSHVGSIALRPAEDVQVLVPITYQADQVRSTVNLNNNNIRRHVLPAPVVRTWDGDSWEPPPAIVTPPALVSYFGAPLVTKLIDTFTRMASALVGSFPDVGGVWAGLAGGWSVNGTQAVVNPTGVRNTIGAGDVVATALGVTIDLRPSASPRTFEFEVKYISVAQTVQLFYVVAANATTPTWGVTVLTSAGSRNIAMGPSLGLTPGVVNTLTKMELSVIGTAVTATINDQTITGSLTVAEHQDLIAADKVHMDISGPASGITIDEYTVKASQTPGFVTRLVGVTKHTAANPIKQWNGTEWTTQWIPA